VLTLPDMLLLREHRGGAAGGGASCSSRSSGGSGGSTAASLGYTGGTGSAAGSVWGDAPDALTRYKTAAALWELDFDEIEIVRKIGEGSFGEVLLGNFRGTKVGAERRLGVGALGCRVASAGCCPDSLKGPRARERQPGQVRLLVPHSVSLEGKGRGGAAARPLVLRVHASRTLFQCRLGARTHAGASALRAARARAGACTDAQAHNAAHITHHTCTYTHTHTHTLNTTHESQSWPASSFPPQNRSQ
jgi:hypothetical protein